jgi:NAD(P)-dependent dehydrogenase (short-subunit alcohol dehydrogenase family)
MARVRTSLMWAWCALGSMKKPPSWRRADSPDNSLVSCSMSTEKSGALYLARAILQHMLDRGPGRFININSIIGEAGNIGQANYASSKAGLFGLTMSLAQETARKGITVNSLAPGYISTEMVQAVPK